MKSVLRMLSGVALATTFFLQALPAAAAVLTVTTTDDDGPGSLRDAVHTSATGDVIRFDAALAGQTIHLQSSITVFRPIVIDGSTLPTAVALSGDSNMDGTGDVRIFTALASLTLDSVTLTRGYDAGFGGAISAGPDSVLTIKDCTVENSVAAVGGGVSAHTVVVSGSTFSLNAALHNSGAIFGHRVTISNSTLAGNVAGRGGALLIDYDQHARIVNTTMVENGFDSVYVNGVLDLENTVIARSAGADCVVFGGSIGANDRNLIQDGSCNPSLSGDAGLGNLADNGGRTATVAAAAGSPVIDAGSDAVCALSLVGSVDQRGEKRPSGYGCDIGAVESGNFFTVTVPGDVDDGACNANCSLREAMNAARGRPGPDAIRFASAMAVQLTRSLPTVEHDLMIDAEGQAVEIRGSGNPHMFVAYDANLRLSGLTVKNGRSPGAGAALYAVNTNVVARDCTFESNVAGDQGGAIFVAGGLLQLDRCSFFDNVSSSRGGAISILTGGADINNCTFGANFSTDAAISISANPGYAQYVGIVNSTFSGNTGSVYSEETLLGLVNNIMANSLNTECASTQFAFNLHNLIEDGTCSPAFSGDPNLAPVAAYNGGPTKTFELLAPSVAIDAAHDGVCLDAGPTDQRGVVRPIGAHCDLGSYESGTVLCGNGVQEGDEACDDGNLSDDDCCSSTCTPAFDDTPCDGPEGECLANACLNGQCVPTIAPDGMACTDRDSVDCTVGICTSGACEPVANDARCAQSSMCVETVCDLVYGCILGDPLASPCENDSPGSASVSIRGGDDPSKWSMQFKWGKASFEPDDIGLPFMTTAYAMCVFSDGNFVAELRPESGGAMCGEEPCWKSSVPSSTYKDRRKPALGDGVTDLKVSSSSTGKGKLQVKAKGAGIPSFTLGSGPAVPVTVQVRTSDASCWQADFEPENVTVNDGEKLKAKF